LIALAVPAGISKGHRAHLETLHRLGGAFSIDDAAEALDLSHTRASRLLGYLARRGWLSRIRRGLYVAVPLDARQAGEWREDAWVVADLVFSPCYIGGWSACEYWDLTEQLFRTMLVVTAKRVRERDLEIQGLPFHVTVRSRDALFGTTEVWRGRTRVTVSDPSRTLVDVLDDPRLGGGIRTVADVLREYMSSIHRDDDRVIEYGDRLANHAVFKRLGYLLEELGIDADALVAACRSRRSAGLVALDPSVKARGRILRRWGLRINVPLGALAEAS
jgi:predicted transcriptional regulator of viral defense system